MTARIIDGSALAATLIAKITQQTASLAQQGVVPGLAVILVGDDPGSAIYVRNKVKRTAEAGMRSFDHRLPGDATESDVLGAIARLNADTAVHGILLQLPLPSHIDAARAIAAIDPAKDIDGLHPLNVGKLVAGETAPVPCTPRACIILAKSVHASLAGMEAVVIGRSLLVGKPLSQLLLGEDATVTVAHSKTKDLVGICRRADLLFAAIGRPEFVRGAWIKPGATVIDVGIARLPMADGKMRIAGDVAFAEARDVAGAITPVPGGVGPMTIACLLLNTLTAASRYAGLPAPRVT